MSERKTGMQVGMSPDYHVRVAELKRENEELKETIKHLEERLASEYQSGYDDGIHYADASR